MRPRTFLTLLAAGNALVFAACMGTEDERSPVGPGSAAAAYCARLGFGSRTVSADAGQIGLCVFGDGSSCVDQAFYTATCGQEHSYCVTHGGSIANTVFDAGTWVGTSAVCTISGHRCDEDSFSKSGHCP